MMADNQHLQSKDSASAAANKQSSSSLQNNRYAHLVAEERRSTTKVPPKCHPTTVFNDNGNHRAQVNLVQQQQQHHHHNGSSDDNQHQHQQQQQYHQQQQQQQQQKSKAPPLNSSGGGNYYCNSFSGVDWRQQWSLMKTKILDEVEEPQVQRKLILIIVCCALLLDNMLYMVIVPIIPDYLRSIGAWSTYTENAKWIRRNVSGLPKWERIGGQVVYEGEDSAVGFLFASKAIVQLFINPFSGALIDRIGYEIPMMIGLIVMFFSTMVFACGQTYSILFLARSLQGVGSAFADTSGLAMIADRFTEDNERQRALGVALAFISFGCLVAPPFGSVLYEAAGKEVPFIILSLVCLLDGSLLLLVTPPGTFQQILPKYYPPAPPAPAPPPSSPVPASHTKTSQRANIEDGSQQEMDGEKKRALMRQKSISRRQSMTVASAGEAPKGTPIYVLFRDPCIACCSGALIVANVSLAFLEPTISIWVQNTMPDIEEWQLGLIWLPAFVPHVFGVYCTVKLADKYPRYQWLIAAIGLVLEGLSCLMVPFCSSFWSLIIPISIICFGLALIDTAILPTLGFLVDSRYVSVYGSIYAIADISYSLSYAIGPIIAGGIVEAIGFTALNFLIAIVTLGYTPILMMLRSIHDYEPFEADNTGLKHKQAKELAPFGKFGRPPGQTMSSDDDGGGDDDDDDEASLDEAANLGTRNKQFVSPNSSTRETTTQPSNYESPRWVGAANAGQQQQQPVKGSLVKKASLKSPATSGGGGGAGGDSSSSNPSGTVRKQHSVKIIEHNTRHYSSSSRPDVDDQQQQQQSARNPFLPSPPPPPPDE